MADQKISELTELTTPANRDFIPIVDVAVGGNKKISRENLVGWHFLTTPRTSTSWDGDARSTTAKTLIDLSSVFGAPAGIKAVLFNVALRDSGSAANECLISLSPSLNAGGLSARCSGVANDKFTNACLVVPCDANGDVYYDITASGTGTMDVYLQIYGYWL